MDQQSEVSTINVNEGRPPMSAPQSMGSEKEESALDDARSPYASFELPIGYLDYDDMEGDKPKVVRDILLSEITGKQEDMLAARGGDANQKMNNLMVDCIKKIGKYEDKPSIAKIIKALLSSDRFFLVYKIREISLGKEYRFSSPCPNCGDDKLRFTDLSEVTFPTLEDTYTRFFVESLPRSKKMVKWKLQDGEMESTARSSMQRMKDNVLSAAILQRLTEFDGRPATIQDVQGLPSFDRNYLRGKFEEKEGKIDDLIEVDCPACGHHFTVETNIGDKEFFFPTA